MSKINILRSKNNGHRVGDFYKGTNSLRLTVYFRNSNKVFGDELFKLLNKYFTIVELNQTSNKRGRGSVTRSRRYDA